MALDTAIDLEDIATKKHPVFFRIQFATIIIFTMRLKIKDDFDIKKIKNSGQVFRITEVAQDHYTLVHKDNILDISVIATDTYELSCNKDIWQDVWFDYFDMARNYENVRAACRGKNSFIDMTLEFGAGLRILHQDPWEMLITFIISQRKSMSAIATSVEALCQRFGSELDNRVYQFPTAEQLCSITESEIQSCGVGYRAEYIKRAAQMVASGELDLKRCEELCDEELGSELLTVRGVGPKVANCIMLFGFGRVSRAPIDVWIQRVIDEDLGGSNPFPKYGEFAGIVQQYLFYFKTQTK